MRKLKCILNPAAARGKTRKLWPRLTAELKRLGLAHEVAFTQYPGHGIELAREALKSGFDEIVAIGGDGTVNEVVNGFFENNRLINPEAKLGIIPRGTGIDVIRSLPLPANPVVAAEVIQRASAKKVDVGRLQCLGRDNQPVVRYFLNIADLGYGGALVDRVNGFTKFLGSFLSYFVGLLYTLTFYNNEPIRYRIDDGPEEFGVFSAIIAANGQYFGGGMWIAPGARLDDGQLEFVLIGDVSKMEVIANLRRLYQGKLAENPKVVYRRGKKLEAHSDHEVLLDADGELPGKLPATFEVLPGVLSVYV